MFLIKVFLKKVFSSQNITIQILTSLMIFKTFKSVFKFYQISKLFLKFD